MFLGWLVGMKKVVTGILISTIVIGFIFLPRLTSTSSTIAKPPEKPISLEYPLYSEKPSELEDLEYFKVYRFIQNKPNFLLLVNKSNGLALNYIPKNLVRVEVPFLSNVPEEEMYLQKDAAEDLKNMFDNAKQQGFKIFGVSAYRSYETQKKLYDENLKIRGQNYVDSYVAKPGESEHQTGLAIDVRGQTNITSSKPLDFGQTKEGVWVRDNAHKFGFIIRYQRGKESITGYSYEPWHIRYVGRPAAEEIKTKNIAFEEYFIPD
jgi:D-alanyl-D-alanine carboxypeptidase